MLEKCIIEAILFAAGHPIEYVKLAEAIDGTLNEVKEHLAVMAAEYEKEENCRGIRLVMYEDSCQLCTKEEYIDKIRGALGIRNGGNLSKSSLEVLAIVAYHQPVTRSYIDSVRGIDSNYSVNNLVDKGLIEVCGRLDAPGRPALYQTTNNFLRLFGISTINELVPVDFMAAPEILPEKAEGAEAAEQE